MLPSAMLQSDWATPAALLLVVVTKVSAQIQCVNYVCSSNCDQFADVSRSNITCATNTCDITAMFSLTGDLNLIIRGCGALSDGPSGCVDASTSDVLSSNNTLIYCKCTERLCNNITVQPLVMTSLTASSAATMSVSAAPLTAPDAAPNSSSISSSIVFATTATSEPPSPSTVAATGSNNNSTLMATMGAKSSTFSRPGKARIAFGMLPLILAARYAAS